jgi:hypothetical protein
MACHLTKNIFSLRHTEACIRNNTKQVGSGDNASDLYLGSIWFESWLGHQLSQGFLWSYSAPTQRMLG